MTPAEAAKAVNEIEGMIAEMQEFQAIASDPLVLLRISVQLANLRREQRYLIGLIVGAR